MKHMIKGNLLLVGNPAMRRAVARRGFAPGDNITTCSTLQLSAHDGRLLKKTNLGERLFHAQDRQILFALGYSSLCLPVGLKTNTLNARAVFDPRVNAIQIICSHRIDKGEKVLCSPETLIAPGSISMPVMDEKVEVRESPGRGRGIFARRAYALRAEIGRYPVLVVPSSQRDLIFKTVFDKYHCDWGYGNLAIPLGFWMLHNTTSDGTTGTTNATYRTRHRARMVVNYCIRPIVQGDEITIPYRDTSEPLSKLEMYGIAQ